jgi:hypothetical protein
LRQVYADAAMARLRAGLHDVLERNWPDDPRVVVGCDSEATDFRLTIITQEQQLRPG